MSSEGCDDVSTSAGTSETNSLFFSIVISSKVTAVTSGLVGDFLFLVY